MIVSEIRLFELLKAKIGEKEAEAFVEILASKVDQKFEEAKSILATKEDLANNRYEIIKWTFSFVFGALLLNIIAIIGAVLTVANILKH